MIAVRPLAIGEIFDRAVTLLARRWRAALVLALLTGLPASLGTLVETYAHHNGAAIGLARLLDLVGGMMALYGSAAFMLLVAGEADRPSPLRLLGAALARFWPILRAALVTGSLIAVVGGLGFAAAIGVAKGMGVGAGIVVGVLLFLAVASLLFVFELGFTIAVLEHVGGRAGLKAAWRRAFHDSRGRTWRLAVASLAAYLAPVFVFESAGAQLAPLPGLGWVPAAASLAENLTAFAFFNAVLAVASVDYRVRAEGADLEAALDAPLPA